MPLRTLPTSLLPRREIGHFVAALRLVGAAAGRWSIAWLLTLVALGLLPLALVLLARRFVDGLLTALRSGAGFGPIVTTGLLLVAILVATELLGAALDWLRVVQAELVRDYASGKVHDKCCELDLSYYESATYYDQLHRAAGEGGARATSLLEGTGSLLQNGVTLVGFTVALVPYGAWLPFVLIGSALPGLVTLLRHSRRHHAWWEATTADRRWTQYYDGVLKSRDAAPELRVLDIGKRFRQAFQEKRRLLREGQIALVRRRAVGGLMARGAGMLVTLAILLWMLKRLLDGEPGITIGDLVLFQQVFSRGQAGMRTVVTNLGSLYRNVLYLESYFEFLGLKPLVRESDSPLRPPRPLTHAIRFEGVTFRYPGSDAAVLDGFDLEIPARSMVAIVGANGAGKSTLVKLLLRLYDPEEGRVTWDGHDLRELSLRELQRAATVLFQVPIAYQGTANENIAMGDVGRVPDPEAIRRAATVAEADEMISRLPQGYRTHLGKIFRDGTELSAGEYQRLALARAFYREADLIVLDEPTSFMDSWAEARWLESFAELARGHTSVIITHRFTIARLADRIHVMDRGRILETGSHEELLKRDGEYADSWRRQTSSARREVRQ